VVIGDPRERTADQLRLLGDFVDALEGRCIVSADTGLDEEEIAVIAERTGFVVGLPDRLGGCGQPGPYTARGVHLAMEAALRHRGRSLEGARVAIQGMGTVGSCLAGYLLASGARPIVADTLPESLSDLPEGVEVVTHQAIVTVECDVFSPCGPAGAFDAQVAEQVCCHVVCGSANSSLEHIGIGSLLEDRGILYVPDFLANAGGLIHLAVALEGGNGEDSWRRLAVIPENLERVMAHAAAERVSTAVAAERLASTAITGLDDS
jgi:leucine dehydrogenase